MRSAILLSAFAVAASMQSLLRQVPGYRPLYQQFPFYVPESLKAALAVAVCLVIARLLYGRGDHFALRHGAGKGLAFGVLASLPMWIGLSLTRDVAVKDP